MRFVFAYTRYMTSTIATLGKVMGIWAHPDDETMMIGGLMALAAQNSQLVQCIIATRGEAGVQDTARWPQESLGSIRQAEVCEAMRILGVPDPLWLGYQDGCCHQVVEAEAIQQLVRLIDTHKPDTVITFAPDGLTGHSDHKAVSRWATSAVQQAAHNPGLYYGVQTQESYDDFWHVLDQKFNLYFATDNPCFVPQQSCDIVLSLEPTIRAQKAAALRAMPSQFTALFDFLGDKGVEAAVGTEALIRAK